MYGNTIGIAFMCTCTVYCARPAEGYLVACMPHYIIDVYGIVWPMYMIIQRHVDLCAIA